MHYTSKVAEKGFKMASMTNKLAMKIVKLFLKNEINFFAKNHCTILVSCMHIILDKIR